MRLRRYTAATRGGGAIEFLDSGILGFCPYTQAWLKIAQKRPNMTQNRSKMEVSGQNKHCQNTADRKPKYHAGAQRMAYFLRPLGRRYQIWVTKGPKGPICCQIWNALGSIGSVFGSSVRPRAPTGTGFARVPLGNEREGPKCTKMPSA